MNLRRAAFRWMKRRGNQSEREFRFGHGYLAGSLEACIIGYDQTGRSAVARAVEEFFVLNIGDITRGGGVESGYSRNRDRRISNEAAAYECGQFRNQL